MGSNAVKLRYGGCAMKPDRVALLLVIVLGGGWILLLLGLLIYRAPFGTVGTVAILVVAGLAGWILYRVIVDRLRNAEDDYYEKIVDK